MRECEELLKFVQRSRDSRLDLAGGSRLQATRMMHTCQACQKLKRCASCCTTGQKSQASQAICSRLELATQPSREVKSPEHPIWENLTFHIPFHPTIYILFKFLYSFPLRCQILERLITKTFSYHIHSYERAIWCFGKQLERNQFHIG